jgi:hypothetical protein
MLIKTQKCPETCGKKSGMIFHNVFTGNWLKVEVV